MNWEIKSFNELSNIELYNILKLRSEIFVIEQNCVYLDLDDSDKDCLHLFTKNKEEIAAYCRIVPPGIHYTQPSIGRVVCNTKYRAKGLGKTLLQRAIEHCNLLYPSYAIKIRAQFYLKKFYENLGFKQIGEIYDEDGIEHIKMLSHSIS